MVPFFLLLSMSHTIKQRRDSREYEVWLFFNANISIEGTGKSVRTPELHNVLENH